MLDPSVSLSRSFDVCFFPPFPLWVPWDRLFQLFDLGHGERAALTQRDFLVADLSCRHSGDFFYYSSQWIARPGQNRPFFQEILSSDDVSSVIAQYPCGQEG